MSERSQPGCVRGTSQPDRQQGTITALSAAGLGVPTSANASNILIGIPAAIMRRTLRTTRAPVLFIGVCLLTATLSGCISTVKPASFAANTPVFLPEKFFAGTTRGSGILQASDGTPAKQISVTSNGRMLPDGRFQLDQTISQSTPGTSNVEKSTRTWVITKVDATRYTATLTDAAGPVTAEVHGNLFHLKYRFAKPLVNMEQWLYLQADGRTVLNEARISLPGRTIARISEIIVREEE